jgi:hypothetical protein
VSRLRFEVAVAAGPDEVVERLDRAAQQPEVLVGWFTDDPHVDARVVPVRGGWVLEVRGSGFAAEADVAVRAGDAGSVIAVDGRLHGRGLLRLAGPALHLAGPRIEAEARRSLHREFGEPTLDTR